MKKLPLLFCMLAPFGFSIAQSVQYSIKAGINISTLPTSVIGTTDGTGFATNYNLPAKSATKFHIGAFADFSLRDNLSIQPGLVYTTITGEDDSYSTANNTGSSNFYAYKKDRLNYLQIPINILFHIPVHAGKFFIGGGPYVGLGINGQYNYLYYTTKNGLGTNADNQSGPESFTKPDFGLNTTAGFILNNGLLFSGGYLYGMGNNSGEKNRALSFSLGYAFF